MVSALATPRRSAAAQDKSAAFSRLAKASAILLGSQALAQLLRLVGNLALARLLAPDAFGLMAALNALYFGLVMFSDLGIWQLVVQDTAGKQVRFLGTAWVLQAFRGLLIAALIAGVALTLHQFGALGNSGARHAFSDARMPTLLLAFAGSALLQGLESLKIALAQRELRGAALARLELLSQLLALGATLLAAAWAREAWALSLGVLTSAAVRTLASHLCLPGPPIRPCWDAEHARRLIGKGRWVMLSSIIGFIAANGEKFLLGGLLSTAAFGTYAIAATLVGAAAALLSSVNGQVVLAGLSEAQRSSETALRELYFRSQRWLDRLLGFCAGLLFTAGPWIIHLGYDARYVKAAWMLQYLSLGLLAQRLQVAEQLMFAKGAVARVSANNLTRALALATGIPLGWLWQGESGAVAAVVLAQFAAWPATLLFKARHGLLGWRCEFGWLPAFVAGSLLGLATDQLLRVMLRSL